VAITVRPATEADLPALIRLDLTYPTDRVLALDRSGEPPEHTFALRWRNRVPAPMAVYATYTVESLREAIERTDLFLVGEMDGDVAGLLMIIVPEWTNAAEITDLAVDVTFRRTGAGRALVDAAVEWAREQGHRALWVELREDNDAAISFYASLGFRVSGFNDRMYSNV
jgi:ribosomal protein S18 acetylase RimI-like enzyme